MNGIQTRSTTKKKVYNWKFNANESDSDDSTSTSTIPISRQSKQIKKFSVADLERGTTKKDRLPKDLDELPRRLKPNITLVAVEDETVSLTAPGMNQEFTPIVYTSGKNNRTLFVFTGSKAGVITNTYLRLSDLRSRLEGNKILYTKDWKACESGDGRHFPVWNQYGVLVSSIALLRFVYDVSEGCRIPLPELSDERKSNAFLRFCDVADAAGCAPKNPYSVKARFWDEDIHVTLLIAPMENDLVRAAVKRALESMRPDDTVDTYRRKFVPTRILWEDATPEERKLKTDDNMFSAHPHGYYATYISSLDRQKMTNSQKSWEIKPADLEPRVKEVNKAVFPGAAIKPETTTTDITKLTVQTATQNPKRTKTQGQVMKASATDVARIMWDLSEKDAKGTSEWLHRSAYSFGGLRNDTALVSSQKRKNLIFGTYETNTFMIRYETYIKTAATGNDTQVTLTTRTYPVSPDKLASDLFVTNNLRWDWFAKTLEYTATFKPYGQMQKNACKFCFDAFARIVPTRFEVDLDELVDKYYYESIQGLTLNQRKAQFK